MDDMTEAESSKPEAALAQNDGDEAQVAAQVDAQIAAQAAVARITAGLIEIEQLRSKVRPEDWATLFRQMQDLLSQLATHPFVVGDLEAEGLVDAITRAEDLEEVDARVDAFADYAIRKIQFNAELKEAMTGEVQHVPAHVSMGGTSTEVTRSAAMAGPSGSDFDLPTASGETPASESGDAPAAPLRRRGVLRL